MVIVIGHRPLHKVRTKSRSAGAHRGSVVAPPLELRRAHQCMVRHRDDLFKRAAVLEINGTAGIGATPLLPGAAGEGFLTTPPGRFAPAPERRVARRLRPFVPQRAGGRARPKPEV